MAADGREHPAVRAYVPTLTSPHHAQNTVYTSWYIWETTLHCLYQIALDLRPQIGEAAFRGACANLFRGARFRSTARGVFLYTTLFDLPEEVAETRASAWKSLRTATGETIAPLLGMWLITATPRPLKALALRGGVWARWGWGAREELRRLQARRDEHARRRAGAQQGGTGLYRPDDI